jgi:hypothetical protein
MFEFMLGIGVIIIVTLLLLVGIWFFGLWPARIKMLSDVLQEREILVDPDAEIIPKQERHSSEVLKDTAAYVKDALPVGLPQVPQQVPIIPPPTVTVIQDNPNQPLPPLINAPVQPNQVLPPQVSFQPQPELREPPQPLIQRAEILDVPNPIVDAPPGNPPADIDVNLPNDLPDVGSSPGKSDFGVRYSSNPAGRQLRDKRYNRNASD